LQRLHDRPAHGSGVRMLSARQVLRRAARGASGEKREGPMARQLWVGVSLGAIVGGAAVHVTAQPAKVKGGFIVQHDAEIAKNEPGTHDGGGQTIGYSFFDKTPGMKFIFRKRALHPGAGVGLHEQHEDEVYY